MRAIATFFFLLCSIAFSSETDWRHHARRLSGYVQTTQREAVRWLKSQKRLEKKLVPALETRDRYLALDVIAELQMTSLLPELFKWTTRDESGAVVLTINTLLTPQTRDSIIEHYENILSRLSIVPLSIPSMLAVL